MPKIFQRTTQPDVDLEDWVNWSDPTRGLHVKGDRGNRLRYGEDAVFTHEYDEDKWYVTSNRARDSWCFNEVFDAIQDGDTWFRPYRGPDLKVARYMGKDYIGKIIRPELRSHTRIAIAEFPADRVYSAERVAIQTNMETRLKEKLARNYILVDEVLLRAISFSDTYQNAIIQKQISQQNAQRMQYVLSKEQQEKRRKIILAEGEAESIRLKGQAIATNPRVVAYQYVQKVAPNIKTILSSGNVPVPTVGTDKP